MNQGKTLCPVFYSPSFPVSPFPSPRPSSMSSLLRSSPGSCVPVLARPWWRSSRSHSAPHLCGVQEVQYRSGTPFVREHVSDLEAVLPSSRTPPHPRRVCVLRPFQVFPGAAVPRSKLVKPPRQSLRSSLHCPVRVLAPRHSIGTSSHQLVPSPTRGLQPTSSSRFLS